MRRSAIGLVLGLLILSVLPSCSIARLWRKPASVIEAGQKIDRALEARDIENFQNEDPEFFEAKAAHHRAEAKRNDELATARREADAKARIETLKWVAFWAGAISIGIGMLALAAAFVPYFSSIRGVLLSVAIGFVLFGSSSIGFSVYFVYFCWAGAALLVGFGGSFIIQIVRKHNEVERKTIVASEFARVAGERILALPKAEQVQVKKVARIRQKAQGIHNDIEEHLAPLRAERDTALNVIEKLPAGSPS